MKLREIHKKQKNSELISLMGHLSDTTEIVLSEKDLNAMDINFLVRPMLEFQSDCQNIAPSQNSDLHERVLQKQDQNQKNENEKKEDKCKLKVSSLEMKLPSLRKFKVQDDEGDDGLKTPTSLDLRIPVILKCPPAPRKPKSLPSTKRKATNCRRKILLDLSKEIESLFPPAVLADFGNKIKRAAS